jgi:hypothetical protein
MSIAHHAVFHSVARQFIIAANGDPHADKFLPWLNRPEQHELWHAFMAAMKAHGPDAEAAMRAFVEVLAIEFNHWKDEQQ